MTTEPLALLVTEVRRPSASYAYVVSAARAGSEQLSAATIRIINCSARVRDGMYRFMGNPRSEWVEVVSALELQIAPERLRDADRERRLQGLKLTIQRRCPIDPGHK